MRNCGRQIVWLDTYLSFSDILQQFMFLYDQVCNCFISQALIQTKNKGMRLRTILMQISKEMDSYHSISKHLGVIQRGSNDKFRVVTCWLQFLQGSMGHRIATIQGRVLLLCDDSNPRGISYKKKIIIGQQVVGRIVNIGTYHVATKLSEKKTVSEFVLITIKF